MKFLKNKGFTLAELLIVLAVVVVLAAATMPAVTGQVETARESVDIDTLRAAYSAAYTQAYMDYNNSATFKTGYVVNVAMTQTVDGWQGKNPTIGGTALADVASGTTLMQVDTVTFVFAAPASGSNTLTTSSITLSKATT